MLGCRRSQGRSQASLLAPPILGVSLRFVVILHSNVNSVHQDLQAATVNPDPSLKEFEGATLRYASLKLR